MIFVTTTRPETILETAICINQMMNVLLPKGKTIVPICGRVIYIEDEYVDINLEQDLKVTPAHDMNDKTLGEAQP
jgi:valyl-tRNA synthetase